MHKLTLLLGIVVIILFILSELNIRRQKLAYNFEVLSLNIFILKLIFVSLVIGGITWILAGYNGLSWTVVIVLLVVGVYHFMTTQTVLGRPLYSLAGTDEPPHFS